MMHISKVTKPVTAAGPNLGWFGLGPAFWTASLHARDENGDPLQDMGGFVSKWSGIIYGAIDGIL